MSNLESYDDNSAALLAREQAGDNAAAMSITEISNLLKRTVEERFGYVRLRGELSGVSRAASGHVYLKLKDDKAVIDGVMWKGNAARLAFKPEDGLEVVASGKLTTYPGRSNYQIVIDRMEVAGEGALLALLEKTRARLTAEGLFDANRKKPLPYLPRTIGVVTSPTGAVIRDILHRLADRFPSRVLVWPVLVQGQGSKEQVAAAITGFDALADGGPIPRPDLIIVARGGGSVEDLWSFNEEVVVRAIAACSIPIISAVGHETDTTLADYAADRRAPTPTAAAEMAVPVKGDLSYTLEDFALRQKRAIMRPLTLGRERLEARAKRLPAAQNLLQPQAQRLDDLSVRLRQGLREHINAHRHKLANLRVSPSILKLKIASERRRLIACRLSPHLLAQQLERASAKLQANGRLVQSLNPKAPLERGFALVTDGHGKLVRSAENARTAQHLTLEFADGKTNVSPNDRAEKPQRKTPGPAKDIAAKQSDLFG